MKLLLQLGNFSQVGGVLQDPNAQRKHDAVGGHSVFDDAFGQRSFPVGTDERVVASLTLRGAGADIEEVIRIAVGDFD
jgi:hypothetical protein